MKIYISLILSLFVVSCSRSGGIKSQQFKIHESVVRLGAMSDLNLMPTSPESGVSEQDWINDSWREFVFSYPSGSMVSKSDEELRIERNDFKVNISINKIDHATPATNNSILFPALNQKPIRLEDVEKLDLNQAKNYSDRMALKFYFVSSFDRIYSRDERIILFFNSVDKSLSGQMTLDNDRYLSVGGICDESGIGIIYDLMSKFSMSGK